MSTLGVGLASREVKSLLGGGRRLSEGLWRFGLLQLLPA